MLEPAGIFVSIIDGITHISVSGALTAIDVVKIINAYYPTLAGDCVLWDLQKADVSGISEEDFAKIAAATQAVTPHNERRKTAFAVADSGTFAKIWKYVNTASTVRVPVEYSVFQNVADAKRWLESA